MPDFEYKGKKYHWTNEDQGIIDCTCKGCQKFVKNYVKEGRLSEIDDVEVVDRGRAFFWSFVVLVVCLLLLFFKVVLV